MKEFIDRYKSYRFGWYHEAEKQYNSKVDFENTQSNLSNPLCLDIKIASVVIWDAPIVLEHIITPDKIMSKSMFYQLIDSVSEMNIPSIKLNWRVSLY